MQAPPDELIQSDFNTFPTMDPVQKEAATKMAKEAEKERKAREAANKREAKDEEARAKKMMAMADKAKQQEEAVVVARSTVAHKIRLYFAHFGEKLSVKQPKVLPKDDVGLRELLDSIELELQSTGGIEQASNGYLAAIKGVEEFTQIWNPLGLQLSGPAASLSLTLAKNRSQWSDMVTEFAIAHCEWFMVRYTFHLISLLTIFFRWDPASGC